MAPAPGWVSMTSPAATMSSLRRCSATVKPAWRSWLAAAAAFMPRTSGTSTSSLPDETVMVTTEPLSALVPGSGDCLITRSSSTESSAAKALRIAPQISVDDPRRLRTGHR